MSIYDPGPVVTHEGAGLARAGTQSQPRKQGSKRPAARLKARPVRRVKKSAKPPARGRQVGPHKVVGSRRGPVVESESNANAGVASFHTSQVNAPLGYQGLFYGK